jgi:PAS domain S-box-containing protein
LADRQVRAFLFGRFEVRIGEQTILDGSWNRRKPLDLFKLLALQKDRSIHRERVLDLLWPNLDPWAARNNLRKNLHYLRGKLNGHAGARPIVEMAGGMLILSPDVTIDISDFQAAAARARANSTDPALYEEALALYRDDLLTEDLYADWVRPRREVLRSLQLRLLSETARLYEMRDDAAAAINCLSRLLEFEPLNEDAHRSLMTLYIGMGRRDLALRQYTSCQGALLHGLGVQPARETAGLYHEISRGCLSSPEPISCPEGRLLDTCPDVVYRLRLRPDVRMEYINPVAERILGYPLAALRSADLEFVRSLFAEEEWDDVLEVIAGRRFYPSALRQMRRADGTRFWAEIHNHPIYDESGTIVALEGTLRDVTEREDVLSRLRSAAERQDRLTA